ncbi:MAG: hypothetical protein ACRC3Z_04500 [Phocaeicola sp.]
MKALNKFIQRTSLIVALLLLSTACNDDITPQSVNVNSEEVVVQIPLSIPDASEVSSSRAPDNNAVNDLYVLIFDANGSLKGRKYFTYAELRDGTNGLQPSTTGTSNWVKISTYKGVSYIYGFANLSGTTDLYTGSLKEHLDGISSRSELLDFSLDLTENITRVGSTYLMSGKLESYNITTTSIRTLPLRRIDADITFKISTGGNCSSFVLESYQLFNVPKKNYLVERAATKQIGAPATWDAASQNSHYYNSAEITGLLNASEGFQFYLTENRQNGVKEIDGTTQKEMYAKREKQLKSANPDGSIQNGAYEYAPTYGTYIVLRGYFTGKSTVAGNTGAVEGSVKYVIHLGYAEGTTNKEKSNDFFTNRNTKYTYSVKIVGVDDIIVEVINETETENAPGAEGDIIYTEGTTRFNLDAHYETVLLRFNKSLLARGSEQQTEFFNYYITTPFTKMGSNIVDESWIRIKRNTKTGNVYNSNLESYPATGYLTIAGLINELKTNANTDSFYDANNEVIYTCHIDEFYYDTAPANTPALSGNLWRHFTNVPNRELHILTDVELSPDEQSSITRSTYILSQRAIQTFFDTTSSQTYSAYGVETINETGPLLGWADYRDKVGVYNIADNNTGETNFRAIVIGMKNKVNQGTRDLWTTYLNWSNNGYKTASTEVETVNAMLSNYNRAYLACLQRNRDTNGNLNIDADEIKWYLPALNQYVGMFIGDAGISEEAKLYTENNYIYKHFISSSTKSTATNTSSGNNLWVYWAEESVSISANTEYGMSTYANAPYSNSTIVNHYRCMRNLGGSNPVSFYTESNNSITTPYLNKNSFRSTLSSGELGRHNNWEDGSRLSGNGFTVNMSSRPASNLGAAMQYLLSYTPNSACYSISPTGTWRAPNLREFYLLRAVNKLQATDVARTIFKFYNVMIPGKNGATGATNEYRIGWNFNGSDVNMGTGDPTEGTNIRCVRDN